MGAERRDDYEADFMGGEDALFREKHVSRALAGLMAVPAIGAVAVAVAVALDPAGGLLPALVPLASGALTAGAGLFFSVMRTTVTPEHVRVQYAMLGPDIEVAAITHCEVVQLDTLTRMAFGVKIWPEGWRYIPPGAKAGVRITWRTKKGEKTCTIGATDAVGLHAAIREARARATALTGVRVEVGQDDEVEEEVENVEERDERELPRRKNPG